MKTTHLLVLLALVIALAAAHADTVTWDGGGGNDSWHTALNWSGDTVPSAADDVVLQPGTGKILIAGPAVVHDLYLGTGNTLVADGGSASLTSAGAVTANKASLTAKNGGQMHLPGLTSYLGNSSASTEFKASGTGSVLDLSGLTSVNAGSWRVYATASGGGKVDLGGVTVLSGGGEFRVSASGFQSQVDLSALPGEGSGNLMLTVEDEGKVLVPSLRTFRHSSLTIKGTGEVDNFASVTNVDESSFSVADGAVWALPAGITQYRGYSSGDSAEFSATGYGSVLSLSGLILVDAGVWRLYATASGGGKVDLSGVTVLSGAGEFRVSASGFQSQVDLSALPGEGSGTLMLTVEDEGKVLASSLRTFRHSSLTINGTGKVDSFASVTNVDESSFGVTDGAVWALPTGSTQYRGYSGGDSAEFTASGYGSVLDLSGLISVDAGVWRLYATANGGGKVDLGGATVLSGGGEFRVSASGFQSQVDLSALPGEGSGTLMLTVEDEGKVLASSLRTFRHSSLTIKGTGEVDNFASVTNVDESSFSVTGGAVWALPAGITQYRGYSSGDSAEFTASGYGSVLDFSGLISVDAGVWRLYATASDGGKVDLSSLSTVTGDGSLLMEASGTWSDISCCHLTDFTSTYPATTLSFEANEGGRIALGLVPNMPNVSITTDFGGVVTACDTDKDGFSDFAEAEAGTSPDDISDKPSGLLEISIRNSVSRVAVRALGSPGSQVQLLAVTNLAEVDWESVANLVLEGGASEWLDETSPNSAERFYKAMVAP